MRWFDLRRDVTRQSELQATERVHALFRPHGLALTLGVTKHKCVLQKPLVVGVRFT
jgi:hypothetical protein